MHSRRGMEVELTVLKIQNVPVRARFLGMTTHEHNRNNLKLQVNCIHFISPLAILLAPSPLHVIGWDKGRIKNFYDMNINLFNKFNQVFL